MALHRPAVRPLRRDAIVTVEHARGSYRIDLAHDEHDHDYLWLSDREADEVIRQLTELRTRADLKDTP